MLRILIGRFGIFAGSRLCSGSVLGIEVLLSGTILIIITEFLALSFCLMKESLIFIVLMYRAVRRGSGTIPIITHRLHPTLFTLPIWTLSLSCTLNRLVTRSKFIIELMWINICFVGERVNSLWRMSSVSAHGATHECVSCRQPTVSAGYLATVNDRSSKYEYALLS